MTATAGTFDLSADVEKTVKKMISDASGLDVTEIDSSAHFLEMGLDSIMLVRIRKEIEDVYLLDIAIERFFDSITNVHTLTQYIIENANLKSAVASVNKEVRNREHESHKRVILQEAEDQKLQAADGCFYGDEGRDFSSGYRRLGSGANFNPADGADDPSAADMSMIFWASSWSF